MNLSIKYKDLPHEQRKNLINNLFKFCYLRENHETQITSGGFNNTPFLVYPYPSSYRDTEKLTIATGNRCDTIEMPKDDLTGQTVTYQSSEESEGVRNNFYFKQEKKQLHSTYLRTKKGDTIFLYSATCLPTRGMLTKFLDDCCQPKENLRPFCQLTGCNEIKNLEQFKKTYGSNPFVIQSEIEQKTQLDLKKKGLKSSKSKKYVQYLYKDKKLYLSHDFPSFISITSANKAPDSDEYSGFNRNFRRLDSGEYVEINTFDNQFNKDQSIPTLSFNDIQEELLKENIPTQLPPLMQNSLEQVFSIPEPASTIFHDITKSKSLSGEENEGDR